MADPIPQAEPSFNVPETLHFGGETPVGGLSPEMTAAKAKGAALRAERTAEKGDAKKVFEKYTDKPRESTFTPLDKEVLDLNFGTGEAKKNPSTGKVEMPTNATPEAKALYDEAQTELKAINSVVEYSEITTEAKKTGKSITTILGERAAKGTEGPKTQAEFDAQREKVLDYILDTEVIREGLPELAAITNIADRRKLIEDTLAADPALRTKMLEKLTAIAKHAKELPKPPAYNKAKETEENRKNAEGQIKINLDLIRDKIKEFGVGDAEAEELRGEVEGLIKDGGSIDNVLLDLQAALKTPLENLDAIESYVKAIALKKAGGVQSADVQRVIADFEGKLKTDPDLPAEYGMYSKIIDTFGNQKNPSPAVDGEIYLSPVVNKIDQAIRLQRTMLDADRIINEEKGKGEDARKTWMADRLMQESDLIAEMKNVMSSSIAEVLSKRYDEMVGLEKQRMTKVAEDERKKGDEAIARGSEKVDEVKAKRWIEYNPTSRRKEVHRYDLGSDMKYVTYAGKDGIKRLILRYSDIQLKDAGGNLIPKENWKTVDFSTLSEDSRNLLDGICNKQKSSFEDKLFGDFFLGKRFYDRGFFGRLPGELALRKHEYELLQKNFSDVFEKGINSKAEAKAAVEKLKGRGVKMTGGLLFLLGLLFAAPVIGVKKALTG